MAEPTVNLLLRVPPELKKLIEAAAKNNDRSINYEAVRRLEESFGSPSKTNLKASTPRTIAVSRLKDELDRLRNEMESLAIIANDLAHQDDSPNENTNNKSPE